MSSSVELGQFETNLAPDPVEYAVILPPGYDSKGSPLPLCLVLHGGGTNRDRLVEYQPVFDALWGDGSLPPAVLTSASIHPEGFYVDMREGPQWETLVAEEFPARIRDSYNVRSDPAGTVVTGVSMGGHGSLKLAFRHPERYAAVAAMEPGIEPGFQRDELRQRNLFYRDPHPDEFLFGQPVDSGLWEANNPASLARDNAEAIRDSDMRIYMEAGDEDELNLHDGTEFLHRVLWELDIPHEYHLVLGAGHVGPSMLSRQLECFRWLGAILAGRIEKDDGSKYTEAESAWLTWARGGFEGERPASFDINGPHSRRLLRALYEERLEQALAADPSTARRYGPLPKPS